MDQTYSYYHVSLISKFISIILFEEVKMNEIRVKTRIIKCLDDAKKLSKLVMKLMKERRIERSFEGRKWLIENCETELGRILIMEMINILWKKEEEEIFGKINRYLEIGDENRRKIETREEIKRDENENIRINIAEKFGISIIYEIAEIYGLERDEKRIRNIKSIYLYAQMNNMKEIVDNMDRNYDEKYFEEYSSIITKQESSQEKSMNGQGEEKSEEKIKKKKKNKKEKKREKREERQKEKEEKIGKKEKKKKEKKEIKNEEEEGKIERVEERKEEKENNIENIPQEDNRIDLYEIMERYNDEEMKKMIERTYEGIEKYRNKILFITVKRNLEKTTLYMIERMELEELNYQDQYGNTIIMYILNLHNKNIDKINLKYTNKKKYDFSKHLDLLIDKGVDLNVQNLHKLTPLTIACDNNCSKYVIKLLRTGRCKHEMKDENGCDALEIYCSNVENKEAGLTELLKYKFEQKSYKRALNNAFKYANHLLIVLIKSGYYDFSEIDECGLTLLMRICSKSNMNTSIIKKLAKYIIDEGNCNPGHIDGFGKTALLLCCTQELETIAVLLVKKYGDICRINHASLIDGFTPLIIASTLGLYDLLTLLVYGNYELNVEAIDKMNNTAFWILTYEHKLHSYAYELIKKHKERCRPEHINKFYRYSSLENIFSCKVDEYSQKILEEIVKTKNGCEYFKKNKSSLEKLNSKLYKKINKLCD